MAAELIEVEQGVFYATAKVVTADGAALQFLLAAARRHPRGIARLCAHPDPHSLQHDMLIVTLDSAYVRPHRHPTKSETLLVLEGAADAVLFDDDGTVAEIIEMADAGSGRSFFYRMPTNRYHSLVVRTDYLAFSESTSGPFVVGASEFPAWAPPLSQSEAVADFCARLEHEISVRCGRHS